MNSNSCLENTHNHEEVKQFDIEKQEFQYNDHINAVEKQVNQPITTLEIQKH